MRKTEEQLGQRVYRRKCGKTAILSNGAEYNPTTFSPVDAQTVEQLKMTAEIVCSVFRVPAYKIGVGQPPSSDNVEALEQQYYSQCLQTLIESIELLLDEALETGKTRVQNLMSPRC